MKNKIFLLTIISLLVFLGAVFYFRYQVFYSVGESQNKEIEIVKGQGAKSVAAILKEKGLISNEVYFNYYIWSQDISNKILPGNYFISENMTIPDIAKIITEESVRDIKLTFPEGWTSKQMAVRLSKAELPGEEFLGLVEKPEVFQKEYEFLSGASSLEGYLFPDTYFFAPESSAEKIIGKMLDNFELKLDKNIQDEIKKQEKNLSQIITMASIIEKEVRGEEDKRIVSGIFWNRIEIGQALQSCATISYILGENKKQFTFEETRTPSLYNTYINPGLPPGPINNPSFSSIRAAIYPQESSYNYFLNNPETGETVFSETIQEHNANKYKVGL